MPLARVLLSQRYMTMRGSVAEKYPVLIEPLIVLSYA